MCVLFGSVKIKVANPHNLLRNMGLSVMQLLAHISPQRKPNARGGSEDVEMNSNIFFLKLMTFQCFWKHLLFHGISFLLVLRLTFQLFVNFLDFLLFCFQNSNLLIVKKTKECIINYCFYIF